MSWEDEDVTKIVIPWTALAVLVMFELCGRAQQRKALARVHEYFSRHIAKHEAHMALHHHHHHVEDAVTEPDRVAPC